jgi:hypothetical protein
MEKLDWGQVTPEAVLDGTDEYIYIYNHNLSAQDKVDRTIRFIVGRLNYYDYHLPPNPKHSVKIDIRGQQISDETCSRIIKNLKDKYKRPDILRVSFVKE